MAGVRGITCGLMMMMLMMMMVSPGTLAADWSYKGIYGVEYWGQTYLNCDLSRQSPITIYEGDLMIKPTMAAFTYLNYDTPTGLTFTMQNNGHSVNVAIGGSTQVEVSGGGLPGTYRAAGFHFHWGQRSSQGSEHLINNEAYPMELHIVHYNTKYADLGTAVPMADGLAVLGFMFEISPEDNPEYSEMVSRLSAIRIYGQTSQLSAFSLDSLLPANHTNFYRYQGSLTTPTCDESVTWTVFQETIKISEQQLDAFRQLLDSNSERIVDNFRPVQPLHVRTVEANFNPRLRWTYKNNAASSWRNTYSACGAESQSPINIPTIGSKLDATLTPVVFSNYDSTEGVTMAIKNNGHAAQVDIVSGNILISGSGLPENYKAAQFHFHWGSSMEQGSEHTVDSRAYPMEVHIVHYRESLGSLGNAATRRNGLAVLGFFFEITPVDNPALDPIIDNLLLVQEPGTSRDIAAFTLNSFLPEAKVDYYRYDGSLTTPGCYESVIWTVFHDTIKISESQLQTFRSLRSSDTDPMTGAYLAMVDNFRPVQNLNVRTVKRNFDIEPASGTWHYDGEHGADHWYQNYPACNRDSQSPIAIEPTEVTYESISPIRMKGFNIADDAVSMTLRNNGHTLVCDITGGNVLISGGGLDGEYRAAQFHFHWGSNNGVGSEHVIDGKAYPMELHIVHYNTVYDNIGTAMSQSNGLAVLGFMFEVSAIPNYNYEAITDILSSLVKIDSSASIESIPLAGLLPLDTSSFYRYKGSLTTPPCYESVQWTVFRTPIQISEEQLMKFRALKADDTHYLVDNFRPLQPVNTRKVKANFFISGSPDSRASVVVLSAVSLFTLFWRWAL